MKCTAGLRPVENPNNNYIKTTDAITDAILDSYHYNCTWSGRQSVSDFAQMYAHCMHD